MRQPASRDAAFSARFKEALGGRSKAWLAETTGLSTSTIGDYSAGAIPSAERLFLLADALGVPPRWFATGQGPSQLVPADQADWVHLPRYDLSKFTSAGKPEPVDIIPLRRDWLFRTARTPTSLWLAEMPSDAIPDLAHSGDMLVCCDVAPPLSEGRAYVFSIEGRVLLRRVYFQPDGVVLKAGDPAIEPVLVKAVDLDELRPVALILGVISIHAV